MVYCVKILSLRSFAKFKRKRKWWASQSIFWNPSDRSIPPNWLIYSYHLSNNGHDNVSDKWNNVSFEGIIRHIENNYGMCRTKRQEGKIRKHSSVNIKALKPSTHTHTHTDKDTDTRTTANTYTYTHKHCERSSKKNRVQTNEQHLPNTPESPSQSLALLQRPTNAMSIHPHTHTQ